MQGHGHARGGPVRVVGGRYMFPGGVVHVYREPRHVRYYNVHVRPAVLLESYDPVDGYVWVRGNWRWGGSGWGWVPGSYFVATGEARAVRVEPPSVRVQVVAPAPPPPPSVSVRAGFSAGVGVH